MMTEYLSVVEFDKDLEKLHRKYRHINEDLRRFITVLSSELPNHLPGTYQISIWNHKSVVEYPIYKVKHFRSIDLKGKGNRSGFRIIYSYEEDNDKITLIEIYHKNKKSNEDQNRILKYFAKN